MANQITYLGTDPTQYVAPTSRYATSTVVQYGSQSILSFSTYKRTDTPVNPSDRFTVVSAGQEWRPDLISNTAYGTPDLWWKILEANGLFDVYDLRAGMTIRVPAKIS